MHGPHLYASRPSHYFGFVVFASAESHVSVVLTAIGDGRCMIGVASVGISSPQGVTPVVLFHCLWMSRAGLG
jgi:hypothetical protein